jgi:hypothetical protein
MKALVTHYVRREFYGWDDPAECSGFFSAMHTVCITEQSNEWLTVAYLAQQADMAAYGMPDDGYAKYLEEFIPD